MAWVRVTVRSGGRVELHELAGPNVLIGSGERAQLRVLDESVADRHAEILIRRGRAIVSDVGRAKTGISRAGERLRAPVALSPSEAVQIGDVSLSVEVIEENQRGVVGETVDDTEIVSEIESYDEGLRRYRLSDDREALVADVPWPAIPTDARHSFGDRWAFVEDVTAGVRLSGMLEAVSRGLVRLPVESAVALAAHLTAGVLNHWVSHGPHGALEPRRIHLGVDGSVTPLMVGPRIDLGVPSLEPFLAPERRYGLEPSRAADAYAVAKLVRRLLADRPDCLELDALGRPLLRSAPQKRDADLDVYFARLRTAAHERGLDPTYMHAARAVRLVAGPFRRRIAEIPRA